MRPRATRKRSRPCLFRSLRSPTNALHSPSNTQTSILLGERSEPVLVNSMPIMFVCMFICHQPTACVHAQRANLAGLASSARCARPQHSPSNRNFYSYRTFLAHSLQTTVYVTGISRCRLVEVYSHNTHYTEYYIYL